MSAPATVDRSEFAVLYDGEALRDHRMSVRDLAPALLGLADVFQQSQQVLNPGQPRVSLDIKATGEGSFLVHLAVVWHDFEHLFSGAGSTAVNNFMGFIIGGTGVFAYLRSKVAGRSEETLPDGSVRITLPDGTQIEFPAEVLTLYRDEVVRRGARAAVGPLSSDGIEILQFRDTPTSAPNVTITDADMPAVTAALSDDDFRGRLIHEHVGEQTLAISSLAFQPGNKWRLNDGEHTFWVSITDRDFLAAIDRREIRFGKSDRLRGVVRYRQFEAPDGLLHVEREMIRVGQVIPARGAQQTTLPPSTLAQRRAEIDSAKGDVPTRPAADRPGGRREGQGTDPRHPPGEPQQETTIADGNGAAGTADG